MKRLRIAHCELRMAQQLWAASVVVAASTASAQVDRTTSRMDPYVVHSGIHQGDEDRPAVPFAQTVYVPDAQWLRLSLGDYELGRESHILVRSVATGAEQKMTATALQNWHNNTALFGGDALEVELHVAAGEQKIFVELSAVWVGLGTPVAIHRDWGPLAPGPSDPDFIDPVAGDAPEGGGDPPEALCGGDNRVASNDARVGRLFIGGCTAWMAADGAFLTAGHCVDGDPDQSGPGLPDGVPDAGFLNAVVEFNVPPSLPNGVYQPALPQDQYPVSGSYVAYQFAGMNADFDSIGADWAVFHVGPNANGVTPQQAQNAFFRVIGASESTVGQTLRVTGYGWDWTPAGTGLSHCQGGSNAGGVCFGNLQCPGGTCVAPFCCDGDQNTTCDSNCNAQSATQQTATGVCTDVEDNNSTAWFRYEVDTTPATSGSPVIREANGKALGINTNADIGCDDGGNWGITFDQDTLHDFLNTYIFGDEVEYADTATVFCVFGTCTGTIYQPHPMIPAAVEGVASDGAVVIIPGNYTAANGNVFVAGDDGKAITFIAPFGGVVIGD